MSLIPRSFQNIHKPLRWILLAVAVRALTAVFFITEGQVHTPERMVAGIVHMEEDYVYFLHPVENYFTEGRYYYHYDGRPFAGRMPGYWLPYMMMRFALPREGALALLILMQIVLSGIAVWALARLSWRITRDVRVFYLAFVLSLLCLQCAVFDIRTFSESFSISFGIFSAALLFRYREEGRNRDLIASGFFLTWAIFCRPFLGAWLPAAAFLIVLWERRNALGEWAKAAVYKLSLFFALFAICEGLWIARNYSVLGRFVPLETNLHESYGDLYPPGEVAFFWLAYAWGENAQHFTPGNPAWWYRNTVDSVVASFQFKEKWFANVSSYNRDSIIALRELNKVYRSGTLTPAQKDELDLRVKEKADAWLAEFKSANPMRYYVMRPVMGLKHLLLHSGSGYLLLPPFDKQNVIEKAVKLFTTLMYYVVLIAGTAGLLLGIGNRRTRTAYLYLAALVALPALTVVYISFSIEFRYFLPAFPFLVLCAAAALNKIIPARWLAGAEA